MAGDVDQSALLDLIATTIAKYPKGKYRNLLVNQSYIFMDMLNGLQTKQMTGLKCAFDAMIMGDSGDTGDAADGGPGRYGAYEELGSTATEYMAQGEVPWGFYHTYWVVSSQETRLNAGKEGFIKLTKVKPEGAMIRLHNVLEDDFWSTDAYLYENASKPKILGPEYWITDDGNHINDSGGTAGTVVGGISPTVATYNDAAGVNRWKNQFNNITDANELIDAWDEMFVDCKFKAPPRMDLAVDPKANKFKVVADKTTYKLYKRLQKRLRDNVGSDLSSGQMVFNNLTVEFADQMTARADGTYQTFFINKSTWAAYVESGNNFRKEKPYTPDNQDARAQRIFFWPSTVCEDRRSNGKVFGYPATLLDG